MSAAVATASGLFSTQLLAHLAGPSASALSNEKNLPTAKCVSIARISTFWARVERHSYLVNATDREQASVPNTLGGFFNDKLP